MSSSDIADGLHVRDLLTLVDEVCNRRGVTRDEVCGRARSKAVSYARQEVWWRIRYHPERNYSYPEIARLFDRDHSTIIAGICAHERRSSDPRP